MLSHQPRPCPQLISTARSTSRALPHHPPMGPVSKYRRKQSPMEYTQMVTKTKKQTKRTSLNSRPCANSAFSYLDPNVSLPVLPLHSQKAHHNQTNTQWNPCSRRCPSAQLCTHPSCPAANPHRSVLAVTLTMNGKTTRCQMATRATAEG